MSGIQQKLNKYLLNSVIFLLNIIQYTPNSCRDACKTFLRITCNEGNEDICTLKVLFNKMHKSKRCSLVTFYICINTCIHHPNQIQNIFILPQNVFPCPFLSQSSFPELATIPSSPTTDTCCLFLNFIFQLNQTIRTTVDLSIIILRSVTFPRPSQIKICIPKL